MGCSSNLCPYEDHPFPHRYFNGTVYLNLSSDPFAFTEAEHALIRETALAHGAAAAVSHDLHAQGGAGGRELAEARKVHDA